MILLQFFPNCRIFSHIKAKKTTLKIKINAPVLKGGTNNKLKRKCCASAFTRWYCTFSPKKKVGRTEQQMSVTSSFFSTFINLPDNRIWTRFSFSLFSIIFFLTTFYPLLIPRLLACGWLSALDSFSFIQFAFVIFFLMSMFSWGWLKFLIRFVITNILWCGGYFVTFMSSLTEELPR